MEYNWDERYQWERGGIRRGVDNERAGVCENGVIKRRYLLSPSPDKGKDTGPPLLASAPLTFVVPLLSPPLSSRLHAFGCQTFQSSLPSFNLHHPTLIDTARLFFTASPISSHPHALYHTKAEAPPPAILQNSGFPHAPT